MTSGVVIRHITADITTFSCRFNRFAPFGYRRFVAVGNRSTAIRLSSNKILLLNPNHLEPCIKASLDRLGGVHYIACDLGHHMFIADYLLQWPEAKTIGVPGLPGKRKDVRWDIVYGAEGARVKPETVFGFENDIRTVLFEGSITHAIAWFHLPSKTLIQSDLLMNLPCTEQYPVSSAQQDLFSREFAKRAHPWSIWFRRLIYHVASVDYSAMRRDSKLVAEWQIERIIPCHGDVMKSQCVEAWKSGYEWFLEGETEPTVFWKFKAVLMRRMRRLFLM